MRIVVVGSGFAGSVLARVLSITGHDVTLVERGTHPRFAVGESSTPLAAIALERLARRYGAADLHSLAAYGRWLRDLPGLRRGLKRGFTFYRHESGASFAGGADNSARLLVAASPDDAVADAHWLREDVDAHLVERAVAAGVRYLDRTELEPTYDAAPPFGLRGTRDGEGVRHVADFVVDAAGGDGLGLPGDGGVGHSTGGGRPASDPRLTNPLDTAAVFGHFEGVRPFVEVAAAEGATLPAGPYPDDLAAVHHLTDEGWMYQLRFDHGVVSVGFVVERAAVPEELLRASPEIAFSELVGRHPSLASQFEGARPVVPLRWARRLQRRRARATGPGWARLPHAFAFSSPMFSTGIAWSLLGVERLARILEPGAEDGRRARLSRYEDLLRREADFVERLVTGAYALRRSFDAFAGYSYAYFAAASFAEARQRLTDPPPGLDDWSDDGFLGATDPVTCSMVDGVGTWAGVRGGPSGGIEELGRILAPRKVAGLADPSRNRHYPVDLAALVEGHDLLGLSRAEVEAALPRLRGGAVGT